MRILYFAILIVFSINLFAAETKVTSPKYESETKEVSEKLLNKEVVRFNYCVKGTLTCRTLVLLKDKQTGEAMDMFYNNFVSSERSVALTGYFLKNENGNYRAYSDGLFDGKVVIDTVNEWDKEIRVTFDDKGFPTAHDLNIKTLGTSKYSISNLTFSEAESSIKGIRYDSSNPSYSEPYTVIYERVK